MVLKKKNSDFCFFGTPYLTPIALMNIYLSAKELSICGWQDVLSEMADLAPMLKTLGYDPNDNHPTYGQVPIRQSCIMIKPCFSFANGLSMKAIPLTS